MKKKHLKILIPSALVLIMALVGYKFNLKDKFDCYLFSDKYVPDGIWVNITGEKKARLYARTDSFSMYNFHKKGRTKGILDFDIHQKQITFTFTDEDPKLADYFKKLASENKYSEEGQVIIPEEKKIITHIKFPLNPCRMGHGTFPFGDRIYQLENKIAGFLFDSD